MQIRTSIIPDHINILKKTGSEELNKQAICVFMAIGFFLDKDNYRLNDIALPAASDIIMDAEGNYQSSKRWFNWHYTPRDISFDSALKEFAELFETIIDEQVKDKKVILPLSGGIDSRTQAVALRRLNKDVSAYSYEYANGYPETKIAEKIAKACNFPFKKLEIEKGSLWPKIDELSRINQCQSDFTLPRQMSVADQLSALGDVFSLGHWGDVLFDNMGVDLLNEEELVGYLKQKLYKRGGRELGSDLWRLWNLKGDFESYFDERLRKLLDEIEIDNANSKLRAFKSLYWAPRWTSSNLIIFENQKSITLPYYDDRMCQFICTVPEEYLADRKIQIEYIKKYAPDLASITWQDHRPFNLLNYSEKQPLKKLSYRVGNKVERMVQNTMGNTYVQRNWELQFLGDSNEKQLKSALLDNNLNEVIPQEFIVNTYSNFKKDPLKLSHSIGMLLVLSKYFELNKDA